MTADKPHKLFAWAENWRGFEYLTPDIKERFNCWLRGGKSLKVVVAAGPQTLLDICTACCDWRAQFEAGYPVPLKLVAAFCEPIFTEEGAHSVRALSRLHRFLQPLENVEAEIWDPNVKPVKELKKRVEGGFEKLREEFPFLGLPKLSYLSPTGREAESYIKEASVKRLRQGRRPFDVVLSGPNGAWIPRWMRKNTGELATPTGATTRSGKSKLDLCSVNIFEKSWFTNGFCWGFHPVGAAGDEFGYCEFRGKDAFVQLIQRRLTRARVALMGLGPVEMDDPRLLDVSGPLNEIGIEYPCRMNKAEMHSLCYQATVWYSNEVRDVMFGDGTLNYPHLGHAIARRIRILFGEEAISLHEEQFDGADVRSQAHSHT